MNHGQRSFFFPTVSTGQVVGSIGVLLALCSGCDDVHYSREEVVNATGILSGPAQPINLSPDFSRLLLFSRTSGSARLEIMDLHSRDILASYEFPNPQPVPVPAWSPDGNKILFVEVFRGVYRLRVWDLLSGAIVTPKALLSKNIHGQQWNAAGDRILHFVHSVYDPRPWWEGGRALYWVDPNGIDEPELIVAELGQSFHKTLSSDGRLAVLYPVSHFGTNTLRVLGVAGEWQSFLLDSSLEIGQISWASNETLLMSVRRAQDEFYGIEELSLVDGSVRRITSDEWDLSAASYLQEGSSIRYTVNVDGIRRTRVCSIPGLQNCRWIGPEGAAVAILSSFAGGDSAFIRVAGSSAPPSLFKSSLQTGTSSPVFQSDHEDSFEFAGGVSLDVRTENGSRVPSYYWRANRVPGRPAAALIHVPGGPGLQAVPAWEPYISYLISRGIDVVYMNYEGQTGYGKSYEERDGGIAARANELLAVRRYLMGSLGISPERVLLFGHSYGANVVMYAAAQQELMSPLILASATMEDASFPRPYARCIVAFHGGVDLIVNAARSKERYLELFGRNALDEPCGHFEILSTEGHVFEAPSSNALVFAAVVQMLDN